MTRVIGTRAYRAPLEAVADGGALVMTAVDVWSFGCLLYAMWTRRDSNA